MRPTPAGINPYIFSKPTSLVDAQVLSQSPLGRDATGAHLTAYIVRSEEEAPSPNLKSSANTNSAHAAPAASFQENLVAAEQATYTPQTSARFIKPDHLLSRLEKAQVDHLRARDGAVKKEVKDIGGESGFSLIYETGPDGRQYAVGVATPLLHQGSFQQVEEKPAQLSNEEHDRGINAYQTRLGTAQPLRAGMADSAF